MIVAEVSVIPLGTSSTSLSATVAEMQRVLKKFPGLKILLTPMATILEGEMREIFRAVGEIHEIPFRRGATRVFTRLAIDDRRDKKNTMAGKLRSVKAKLK